MMPAGLTAIWIECPGAEEAARGPGRAGASWPAGMAARDWGLEQSALRGISARSVETEFRWAVWAGLGLGCQRAQCWGGRAGTGRSAQLSSAVKAAGIRPIGAGRDGKRAGRADWEEGGR